jgi:cyanophycinase
MSKKKTRFLIAIGGHEDKNDGSAVLEEVARRVGTGKLVVTTVAAKEHERVFEEYRKALRACGIKHIAHLKVENRQEAADAEKASVLDRAKGVFFTGGDQLRITSQIGDSLVFHRISDIYNEGGVIVGTSSGASAMCETMIVTGDSEESHKVGSALHMAPGLGLIAGVVIDQHFAERGRIGRLLGAIAQNPRNIGLGLDEKTAIVVENERAFQVIGDGAVYVVDCAGVSDSNIAEGAQGETMSIYDVKLHLLSEGERFDLQTRRPATLQRAADQRG